MALKQKRGPGFKYASNLPGSLLREPRLDLRDIKEEEPDPHADVATATAGYVFGGEVPSVKKMLGDWERKDSLKKRSGGSGEEEDDEEEGEEPVRKRPPGMSLEGEEPVRKRTPGMSPEGEEPVRKRTPMMSLEGAPRPRLEGNPLRKKRKLFDTNDEDVIKKKVSKRTHTHTHTHTHAYLSNLLLSF